MRSILYALMMIWLTASVAAIQVELLATDPAPVEAGDYADITFRISVPFEGPARSGVGFTIQETPFITSVSPSSQYNQLRPADEVTTTLRVFIDSEAPEGDMNIVSVLSSDNGPVETEHELFVEGEQTAAEIAIGTIDTTPSTLLPDTDNNLLELHLQNLGEKKAELVTAELFVDERFAKEAYAFSLRDSVASLSSGEDKVLEFYIDIEENTRDAIPARLELRYREKRDQGQIFDIYEKTIPLVIPIDDAPYLEIDSQEQRTEFTPASTENILRITVTNTGNEDAEDVRVRLFPDISYPFTFEQTSKYIGAKIEPGETASVEVKMEVLSDATVREYPIAVELESIVGETRYAQDDEVFVTVNPGASNDPQQTGMLIIGFILIVAIFIGIITYRNRKKKKK